MAKTKRRKSRGRGDRDGGGARGRPHLSLCLIVRDEAAFLDACLRSVEGLVDEIVVVDTGSSDDTVAVALRHGARVFTHPWDDDFAAARNAGLDRARGRWILCLDCDEVLARRDHAALRAATAAAARADAYRLTTRNYTDQRDRVGWVACAGDYGDEEGAYPGWVPTTKVRLWRHRREVRFEGAVHELVEGSLEAVGGRVADCPVPVHHYGLMAKARSADRYVTGAERKAGADPQNLRARYELAIAYRDAGRLDEALAAIEAVAAAVEADADRSATERHLYLDEANVRLVHGDILERLGRVQEALAVVAAILPAFPDSFQAHNNSGSLLVKLGHLDEARRAFQRAHDLAPDNPVVADNLARLAARGVPAATAPADGAAPTDRTAPADSAAAAPAAAAAAAATHTLSVCLIVRDGGAELDRCLGSVAAAADEIIVVDTGSTDDSVAIAEAHGARVHHRAWDDDFSAARNASLEPATMDWVLWLDADDYLEPADLEKLRNAKALTPDVALSAVLVNTGGADSTRFRQVKMFPNHRGIRFRRPVHETVMPALEAAGIPVRSTDLEVRHTGYAEPADVARKAVYYRELMEGWLRQHPEDLDVCFRLGHTAYAAGRKDEALTWFQRVIDAGPDVRPVSLRRHALLFRGRCRLEAGDWAASIPDFEAALALDADDVFANVSLGDALTKAGRREDAVRHLRRSLAGRLEESFPLERDVIDYTAHYFLGENLSALGRVDEAAAAFEAASRAQPERSEAQQALRQLRPSQAASASTERVEFKPPDPVHPEARLTLCMIVRDEEARLGDCLASARDAVDEIVVVDTGSTDGTVAVAQSFGARIGSFAWCDDFSAARNASLELATGDWVLWLDADDRLPAEYHDTIRRLVAGPRDRGYFFVLDDQGYESVSCLQMRLFPNLEGVAFQMPIHEQVTPSLAQLGLDMVPTDIRVVHTGYTTPEVVATKKARYQGIMEGWLETHPEDYIVRSHVALTYHTTGRLEEAAEQYRIIVEESDCRKDRNYVVLTTALLFLGRTWHKLGDLDAALTWLRHAEEVDDSYVLTQHTLADVLLDRGEASAAVAYAEKVLGRDTAQMTFFPIDQRELRYSTLTILGRARAAMGEHEAAAAALREAAQIPVARRSEALGHLSESCKAAGDAVGARRALEEALEIDSRHPRHLFNLGMLHLEARAYEAAAGLFEQVLEAVGPAPSDARTRALLNLGFIAKARGDTAGAEARYREILAYDATHADAHANLGHLLLSAGRAADAEASFTEVLRQQPGLLDIELGLVRAQQAAGCWDGGRARRVLSGVPEAAAAVPGTGDLDPPQAAPGFLQLGAALIRRNLPRCAEMAFEVVLEATDSAGSAAAQAHRCLGEICFTQQRFWDAVPHYEALLRLNPADADAFRRLGDTYTRLGVEDAARMCYERAASGA